MEMTECGKHGKPKNRLLTLPTLFGNPSGIPKFPRPRRLDICLSCAINSIHRHRKGFVTDVCGPQRNVCSGTLRPGVVQPVGPPHTSMAAFPHAYSARFRRLARVGISSARG